MPVYPTILSFARLSACLAVCPCAGCDGIPVFGQLFITDKVEFYGQAVGLIVAETQHAAWKAAPHVKITYTDVQPPVLTIKEALKKQGAPITTPTRSASNKRGTSAAYRA